MKRWLTALAGLVALTACAPTVEAGAATPEAVFERMRMATQKKDWKSFYLCVNPDESNEMLFGMAMGCGMVTASNKDAEAELKALQARHGVVERKESVKVPFDDKAKLKAAMQEVFGGVKDKPALFADYLAFMEKHSKEKNFAKSLEASAGATLREVKIDGANAVGKCTNADGKVEDIAFVKHGSAWFLRMEK